LQAHLGTLYSLLKSLFTYALYISLCLPSSRIPMPPKRTLSARAVTTAAKCVILFILIFITLIKTLFSLRGNAKMKTRDSHKTKIKDNVEKRYGYLIFDLITLFIIIFASDEVFGYVLFIA
jgi:hypothetical protein